MALFSSTDAADNISVPVGTYKRNTEEAVGNADKNKVGSVLLEDHFIDLDTGTVPGTKMRDIITAFNGQVDGVIETTPSAQTLLEGIVDTRGQEIFDRGVAIAKGGLIEDADRILYWTRIQMIVKLKSNAFLFNNTDKQISKDIAKRFDGRSRGHYTINFPGTGKKILISGFDPFQLLLSWEDPQQANPAGGTALALHNEPVTNGAVTGTIQSVIFPVRYRDFDDNVVEDVVRTYIDPASLNKADMMMSLSLNSGEYYFDIERFAGRWRDGFHDNESATNIPGVAIGNSSASNEFYQTTLPVLQIVTGPFDLNTQRVFYDQSYVAKNNDRPHITVANTDPDIPDEPNTNVDSFLATEISGAAVEGSGSNYLSNEVFYRIARLRESFSTAATTKTGHYHIPEPETAGPNEVNIPGLTISQIKDEVKSAIERALLGL